MKSTPVMGENRFLATISTSSLRNLLPKSVSSSTKYKRSKFNSENTPPSDPNVVHLDDDSHFTKSPPSKSVTSIEEIHRADAPKEAPENKEIVELESEDNSEGLSNSDPAVKVVVRIRPVSAHGKEGDRTVRKVSSNTLSIGEREFAFDSVLDSNSNQEDVFQTVGAPLVRSALAGYNTSLLSYGQSGSGKTYTMWGPLSAMVDDPSPKSQQGLVPRIFHMLFSEILKEQENPEGKQINYQYRCSFLEVYNEQIGDLLDPTQRNLEIKDDPKNGLYVENLSEEYVASYEDVTQLLIKGLSSRKVGMTTVNSKSSRSHIVFTFIIESWCKGTSSKHFSSSKTSRISLVDLAGLDNNNSDDCGKLGVKEGRNVKKSLSKLGYLVNTLNKRVDESKAVPYKASCLTHILRESLGGNAKLTVVCNISPDIRNNGETLSTLRFGQQIKSITNEPVINEISEDDVNDLSDQIRQLKEELIRAKSDVFYSEEHKNNYFKGRNVRDSLNQLRVSLNRSLMLPRIIDDHEEEVNVCEDDVKELREQLDSLHRSCERNQRDQTDERGSVQSSSAKESHETERLDEDSFYNCLEENEMEEVDLDKSMDDLPHQLSGNKTSFRTRISISPRRESSSFQEPTLSESPKIGNTQRKSIAFASTLSQTNLSENAKPEELHKSLKHEPLRSSMRSSKIFPGSAESLAVSLHRGLQIIDHHKRISDTKSSSVAFSFEHLTLKTCPDADRANASIQTIPEDGAISDGSSMPLFCSSCKQKLEVNSNQVQDSLKSWTAAVNEAGNPSHQDIVKDSDNDSAKGIRKEKELERVFMEQAAQIEQLNLLVEQYKRGREISTTEPDHVENSLCLEGPKAESKVLACSQPEIVKEKCEVKDVQEVIDHEGRKSNLNENEKEALILEIQALRSKLQSHTAATNRSTDNLRSSLLSRSIKLRKSVDTRNYSAEEIDKERQRWTEMESEWISLTDELRIDLESNRQHAEKVEMELKLEKKCTEELDDALHRSVLAHARMVEHYAELQENYNELVLKHRAIMEGIAEVKRAAAKAGAKGHGAKFAKSLAAELSAVRVERARERELLKKENKSLRTQLRDTAEAVHAAGELLVRLREAEQAASAAEDNFNMVQQENEKLKKQAEKLKRKHKMEMITMKQYLAESKLPESALQPLYREDSDVDHNSSMIPDDDQAWRAEFGAIYQEHY